MIQCAYRSVGSCIEVVGTHGYHDGKLLGYAIYSDGRWDAWGVSPYDCESMRRLRWNCEPNDAIAAIVEAAGAYGMGRLRR